MDSSNQKSPSKSTKTRLIDNPGAFLKSLPDNPGVYQMYDASGGLIYVGKAKNLKKRVTSYFRKNLDSSKTTALMNKVVEIKVIITVSENEALILEANLIKQHHPRYNIFFRDDKSYPYLSLNVQHDYPRLSVYRGKKLQKNRYFGPFPSAHAVKQTLQLMQKLFKIRNCSDGYFNNRVRPCLQYQIQRCTAPCVDLVSKEAYAQQVKNVELFLEGKGSQIIDQLTDKMQQASVAMQFEQAATIRDQITGLREVQKQQTMRGDQGDIDVCAVVRVHSQVGVGLLLVRSGQVLGQKVFYPKNSQHDSTTQILQDFLAQYYFVQAQAVPKKIMVFESLPDKEWLENALSERFKAKTKIILGRGEHNRVWQRMLHNNLQHELQERIVKQENVAKNLLDLQQLLQLDKPVERIECFDISHSLGEATVASCVVYDQQGLKKDAYRKFNINDITGGDDYAAMHQALTRRYKKLKSANNLPSVVLVDGGKGQLSQAMEVLQELEIDSIQLVGIAKGEGRKPGLETLFLPGQKQGIKLPADSHVLHMLQLIRDESHRFAIMAHRKKRAKARKTSTLEDVPGVGAKRRKALLHYFGGMQGLRQASVEEIARVEGINKKLAEAIRAIIGE